MLFRSFGKRLRYILLPTVFPYFRAAVSAGLGFCWKSGVTAESSGSRRKISVAAAGVAPRLRVRDQTNYKLTWFHDFICALVSRCDCLFETIRLQNDSIMHRH